MRVPNRFFGTRVFRYLKLGIRDLKAKLGRVSVLKVCPRGGMPNITLRITGLYKFWVGITGLKNLIETPRHVLFANVSGRSDSLATHARPFDHISTLENFS